MVYRSHSHLSDLVTLYILSLDRRWPSLSLFVLFPQHIGGEGRRSKAAVSWKRLMGWMMDWRKLNNWDMYSAAMLHNASIILVCLFFWREEGNDSRAARRKRGAEDHICLDGAWMDNFFFRGVSSLRLRYSSKSCRLPYQNPSVPLLSLVTLSAHISRYWSILECGSVSRTWLLSELCITWEFKGGAWRRPFSNRTSFFFWIAPAKKCCPVPCLFLAHVA